MACLYYYKLVSDYPCDVTKNCRLTINEIDSNFNQLKGDDIKTAEFVRGENCKKADGTLVITRNNGEKLIVPLDLSVCEDRNFTYDFNIDEECGESGITLTLSYKDDNGENSVTIKNILTMDNLAKVIGNDLLTKVISDSSLRGLGTMTSPLGIAGTEKTGMLAPAIKLLDLTSGGTLPEDAKLGTRFVTRENISDYGYLYNGAGVEKISQLLDDEYEKQKEYVDRSYYWRVPSKADWDALLDSIEPCKYRNHRSAQCHTELGKLAGKFLKSECGWEGQPECECDGNKPYSGCSVNDDDNSFDDIIDYTNLNDIPEDKKIDPKGVDKYGMTIRPAGVAGYKASTDTPSYADFGYSSYMWTTTILEPGQDTYVKAFMADKSGVYQVAECPDPYYSVRLVKNYDGNNYYETEYIDGIAYKAILMPESGQIWLASNFADKKGFVTLDNKINGEIPELLEPNGGEFINESRVEMFINEYNGRYWEKKVMDEGMTIVIDTPCYDTVGGEVMEYCWYDTDNNRRCIEIEIPTIAQENVEYRVYVENCDKVLKNTDDLVIERVLGIIVPILDQERWEREKADTILSGMIEDEAAIRESADTELWEAISGISGDVEDLREDVDELSGTVETLSGRVDDIEEMLLEEIDRAKEAENEISGLTIDTSEDYTLIPDVENDEYGVVLKSKDGKDEHSVKIIFDGNFGSI